MLETFFCKRLTQLRLEKGVSAREMSLALGQSESYINRIENQQMLPSLTVFFYICEYLEISPKDFFDDNPEVDLESIELFHDLQALPQKQREHIATLIKDIKELTECSGEKHN